MKKIEKLNKISAGKSNWIENAKERQKNLDWIHHSQKIAVKILRTLRETGMKQNELAVIIGVSPQQVNKIVRGKENLTLETISKLENALNIELIFHNNEVAKVVKGYIIKMEYVYKKIPDIKETKQISKQNKPYETDLHYNLNLVSEKNIFYGNHS
jgi:transcriptional regulator with XRE-family HTH domain